MTGKRNIYKIPTIKLRKDGRYECRIYLGVNPRTRNRMYRSIYGKDIKQVKDEALLFLKQLGKNGVENLDSFILRDWLDRWLNVYRQQSLKKSTYDNYLTLINTLIIPEVGGIKLDKLKRDEIYKLYSDLTERGYSPATVHNVHKILHCALEQAIVEGVLNQNPCHKMSLPKLETEEKKPLSEEEIEKLKTVLENNSYDHGILFMLNSGLRVGEMLALKWDDVDLTDNALSVRSTLKRVYKAHESEQSKTELTYESPKTKNSNRIIPISESMSEILRSQKAYLESIRGLSGYNENNIVFSTLVGTAIEPRNFNRHLEILCKKADIRIVQSHIFRHTFITMAVKNKMDPRLLKRIVGHSSISITDTIYTHMDVDDLRNAMDSTKKI